MAEQDSGSARPQVICAEAERRMTPGFLSSIRSPYTPEDLVSSGLFICDPEVCSGRIPGWKLLSIFGYDVALRDTCPVPERFSETIVNIDGVL